jgi:hypothetical protein
MRMFAIQANQLIEAHVILIVADKRPTFYQSAACARNSIRLYTNHTRHVAHHTQV